MMKFDFTENEISQIHSLVSDSCYNGRLSPIDRRLYTKNVINFALRVNMVVWVCKHGIRVEDFVYDTLCEYCKRDSYRLKMVSGLRFDPVKDLPVEVLWNMTKNILRPEQGLNSVGRSIINHFNWNYLGIEPATSSYFCDYHLSRMVDVLEKLDRFGYIIFQHCGSVWQITWTKK